MKNLSAIIKLDQTIKKRTSRNNGKKGRQRSKTWSKVQVDLQFVMGWKLWSPKNKKMYIFCLAIGLFAAKWYMPTRSVVTNHRTPRCGVGVAEVACFLFFYFSWLFIFKKIWFSKCSDPLKKNRLEKFSKFGKYSYLKIVKISKKCWNFKIAQIKKIKILKMFKFQKHPNPKLRLFWAKKNVHPT
jgi:hypothetical protein